MLQRCYSDEGTQQQVRHRSSHPCLTQQDLWSINRISIDPFKSAKTEAINNWCRHFHKMMEQTALQESKWTRGYNLQYVWDSTNKLAHISTTVDVVNDFYWLTGNRGNRNQILWSFQNFSPFILPVLLTVRGFRVINIHYNPRWLTASSSLTY